MKRLYIVLLLLSVTFCQTCLVGSQISNAKNADITLKVNKGNWLSADIGAEMLGILLREKLGYKVQFTAFEEVFQPSAVGKRETDIIPECWPTGVKKDYVRYVSDEKLVEDLGAMGIVGQIGWYVPLYSLAQGEFDVFSTFQDPEKARLFSPNPNNATRGILRTARQDWSSYDAMLVQNLDLKLDLVQIADEADMIKALSDAIENKQFILSYAWAPHPLFSKLRGKLVRVALPFVQNACQTDDRIKAGTVNCDYPAEVVVKLARSDLATIAPDAHRLLRKFVVTNQAITDMSSAVAFEGSSMFDIACDWIKANQDTWSVWLQEDQTNAANNSLKVVNIVVPIAVVVPTASVVTFVCVLLGVLHFKRKRQYG